MNLPPTDLQALYNAQHAAILSGEAEKNGSRAIAVGRAAGLAQLLALKPQAQQLWASLPHLPTMPGLDAFYQGYLAHGENFVNFASPLHFPAPNAAFSNAAGSYAYALDYLSRGPAALAGGEAEWACKWGAQALLAAGFPEQASTLEGAWQQPQPASSATAPHHGGTLVAPKGGPALPGK